MQSIVSLTLIVQTEEEMAAGRYREAGRLVLEAADVITTPEEADEVIELCELGDGAVRFRAARPVRVCARACRGARAELSASLPA